MLYPTWRNMLPVDLVSQPSSLAPITSRHAALLINHFVLIYIDRAGLGIQFCLLEDNARILRHVVQCGLQSEGENYAKKMMLKLGLSRCSKHTRNHSHTHPRVQREQKEILETLGKTDRKSTSYLAPISSSAHPERPPRLSLVNPRPLKPLVPNPVPNADPNPPKLP